jgi:hypothetical protein
LNIVAIRGEGDKITELNLKARANVGGYLSGVTMKEPETKALTLTSGNTKSSNALFTTDLLL